MHSLDFFQSISNKEIIIEVLHHSIDYLIENKNEEQTLKLCHKYGLNSPDEFMLVTRTLSRHYRNCCIENVTKEEEIIAEFGNLTADILRLVLMVFNARKPEVIRYLIRWNNSQEHPLVESFDWDVRLVMGDSSYAMNERKITTCTFNCRNNSGKNSTLHFQMDLPKLNEFITELEKAANELEESRNVGE